MRAALLILLLLAMPGGAKAHPHAWIDLRTEILFDGQKKMTALRQTWIFAKEYTQFMLPTYDKNKNGTLDTPELAVISRRSLENLLEYRYFTDIRLDDRLATTGTAKDPKSTLEGGRILMRFTLPLTTPVDPRRTAVTYKIYDPSFFTEMRHVTENPITLPPGSGCTARLEEPRVSPNIIAQALAIDRGGEAPPGLGESMAQKVSFQCE